MLPRGERVVVVVFVLCDFCGFVFVYIGDVAAATTLGTNASLLFEGLGVCVRRGLFTQDFVECSV